MDLGLTIDFFFNDSHFFSRSTIFGVTSFGLSCGHRLFPGVYAKITLEVREWIKEVASRTQEDCSQGRDYGFWRNMKKSADVMTNDFEIKPARIDVGNNNIVTTT